MQQGYSERGIIQLNRFSRATSPPKAGKRKTAAIACLLLTALALTALLPGVYAAGQFGVTTTGSTNYPTAKAITAGGTVAVDTSVSKFGGGSASFTGTNGQYIRIAESTNFNFGSNAFTVEMWINLASTAISQDLYTKRLDSTKQISVTLLVSNDGKLQLVANFNSASGTWDINSKASIVVPINTWTHVALVRSGNIFTVYQNGAQVIQVTRSTAPYTLSDDGSYLLIGGASNTYSVNGHIDEVRISNIARWTSSFTPSATRYDHDGNTLVLLHLDGTTGSTTFRDDVVTGQATATKVILTENDAVLSSVSFYSHSAEIIELQFTAIILDQPLSFGKAAAQQQLRMECYIDCKWFA